MRRYESPAENWPRAFRIVQTYSSEYYFLFKYIRIPIFQIKLKILSLSLSFDQRSTIVLNNLYRIEGIFIQT